jgi:hypothetical protein
LVEAADTGPFFHNNAIETIEGAVAFYDGETFNNSPAGRALGGIKLDGTQIVAVGAFLRVLNALENIRAARANLESAKRLDFFDWQGNRLRVDRARHDIRDAVQVLAGGGLHPDAVAHLEQAGVASADARSSVFRRDKFLRLAVDVLDAARAQLVGAPATAPTPTPG